jgi:iron complex outermembrane receptor protein
METFPRRRFGYDAWDGVLQGVRRFRERDSVTVGVDGSRDSEQLIEVFTVDRQTGRETRTSAQGQLRSFTNVGVYAQLLVHPLRSLGLVGNVRHDWHSVYGGTPNFRVGAVFTPREALTAKLLFGTSYKAPTSLQLYAQPLFPGEAVGNDKLVPERARMVEGELLWRPLADLTARAAGFLSEVRNKVEIQPVVANLRPVNVGRQRGFGGELEIRGSRYSNTVVAQAAYQNTDTLVTDPFRGEVSAPSERYPRLMGQLRWQYHQRLLGTFGAALRYVSPRRASASNIRENLQVVYELPAYGTVDFAYFKSFGSHAIQLRLDNAFAAPNAEPGFGGVDLPRRGRHLLGSYGFEF